VALWGFFTYKNIMIEYYKNLSLESLFYVNENGLVCQEEWRDVPEWEGYYQVSDLGRIKSFSFNKTKILKGGFNRGGYLIFVFCVQQKRKTVKAHQLVAMVFMNHIPCGNKIVVDHINNIKTDNRLENLQLTDNRHNSSKDRKSKTNVVGVHFIQKRNTFVSCIEIKKKQIHLGTFDNLEDAKSAYLTALNNYKENNIIPEKIKFQRHRKPKGKYSSDYKGVSFIKSQKKWKCTININGKNIFIGNYNTEIDAHLAYQKEYKKTLFKR
jgi:hypothetical protein